jgi:hypothetical protein
MQIIESTTDFETSAVALTVAPSTDDLWLAVHWVSHGVTAVPAEHKSAAVSAALQGLLRLLPPAPKGRRAVFASRCGVEVR